MWKKTISQPAHVTACLHRQLWFCDAVGRGSSPQHPIPAPVGHLPKLTINNSSYCMATGRSPKTTLTIAQSNTSESVYKQRPATLNSSGSQRRWSALNIELYLVWKVTIPLTQSGQLVNPGGWREWGKEECTAEDAGGPSGAQTGKPPSLHLKQHYWGQTLHPGNLDNIGSSISWWCQLLQSGK